MKRILTIIFVIILFSRNLTGQDQTKAISQDSYAGLCYDLASKICGSGPLSELKKFFCHSLQNDSLIIKLEDIRNRMVKGDKNCSFYIRGMSEGDLFYYNVFIYNKDLKKPYGDVRFIFFNEDDMKVDLLLYFDYVEKNQSDDMDELENIPPPPGGF